MSDPQRLVTHCGNEIRQLVNTEKLLRVAMTDLRASAMRSDSFRQRQDETEWSKVDKLNGKIQEDAHHAAVQLSSAIDIYLTMHDEVSAEEVGDLIVELGALKTELNGYRLDQHDSLRIMIAHASQVGKQHAEAVQERFVLVSQKVEDANAEVSALQKRLQELSETKCTPDAQDNQSRAGYATTFVYDVAAAGLAYARAWMSSPGPGQSREHPPPTPARTRNSSARYGTDTQKKSTTRDRSDSRSSEEREIRLVQDKLVDAQKRLNAARTAVRIYDGIDWETATTRFSTVLRYLEKEQKEMNALPELRKQLLNEVDAYLLAAESFKAYPGAPRHAALQNMRQRLLSTTPAWREVEELLATGYAKGHL